jgi:hypothetical protein
VFADTRAEQGFEMNLFTQLLRDESGFVLSAEMAILGTVGVIGATVGLSAVARAVNDELTDVAMAFRSLDQSYCFEGASGCGSYTAGSSYKQAPVEHSLKELRVKVEKAKAREQALLEKEHQAHPKDGNSQPLTTKKPGEKQPEMKKSEAKKPTPESPKKRKKNQERTEDQTGA